MLLGRLRLFQSSGGPGQLCFCTSSGRSARKLQIGRAGFDGVFIRGWEAKWWFFPWFWPRFEKPWILRCQKIWNLKCRTFFFTHHTCCILNGICCSMKFYLQSYSWTDLEEVPEALSDVKMFGLMMQPFGWLRFQGFQEVGTLREALSIWVHDLHPAVVDENENVSGSSAFLQSVGHFNKLLTIAAHGSYQYIGA